MRKLLLLAVVCAAVLAACGESEEERAQAQVCGARDDIAEQIEKLSDLTVTTATTTEVQNALGAIRADLTDIRDAQAQLSGDQLADVQAANEAFAASVRQTITELGTTASIEQAGSELRAALQTLADSYRSTFGALECP